MGYSEGKTEAERRRDLVLFSKLLHRLGFMPGTSGNLSIRLDRQRLLVTPTSVSKFLLTAEDMVIVDLEGRQLEGSRKVTSELSMHLASIRRPLLPNSRAHNPTGSASQSMRSFSPSMQPMPTASPSTT